MIQPLQSSDGLVYLIRFGCCSEVVGISRVSNPSPPPKKKCSCLVSCKESGFLSYWCQKYKRCWTDIEGKLSKKRQYIKGNPSQIM